MSDLNVPAAALSRRRLLSGLALASGAAALSAGCAQTKTADTAATSAPASATPSAAAPAPVSSKVANAARQKYLVDVFESNFGEQMRAQPKAWRRKFRKMASGTFPFYRGSAAVYYTDIAAEGSDPFVTKESGRIWIQGDLHGENFGTYLDPTGRLVFDVNDFDEVYVGPYTWDLRRFSTSMALVGYDQSLADDQISDLINTFVGSYTGQIKRFAGGEDDQNFALSLDNTKGPVRDVLEKAREMTRVAMLNGDTEIKDGDRRFTKSDIHGPVDDETKAAIKAMFESYLKTIPEQSQRAESNYRLKDTATTEGFGIGSAGLRMYALLLEGPDQTLDNDIILSLKQSRKSAVAIAVPDQNIKDALSNQAQRIVIGRRALQANTDPWLGYGDLKDTGMVITEVSPYGAAPEWKDLKSFDDVRALVNDLGRVVAKIHSVADKDQKLVTGSPAKEILASFDGKEKQFATAVEEWARAYAEKTRTDHQLFADAFRNREFPSLA